MNTLNCCAAAFAASAEPKIRVAGGSSVSIDPIATIADLAAVTRKFGRIAQADLAGSAMKLTTASWA